MRMIAWSNIVRTLSKAIVAPVAVRTQPVVLTAGTTLLGNWVLTLDPAYSGLAWAIIFAPQRNLRVRFLS